MYIFIWVALKFEAGEHKLFNFYQCAGFYVYEEKTSPHAPNVECCAVHKQFLSNFYTSYGTDQKEWDLS